MIDGHEDGVLLAAGQALDLLQALEDLAAGLTLRHDLGQGAGLKQLLNGDVEGGGETQGGLCGDAELADLIVGDDDLYDTDTLGELALTEAAQCAEARPGACRGPG